MNIKDLYLMPNDDALRIMKKLKGDGELPSDFEIYYEVLEEARIKALPSDKRKILFSEDKERWCKSYPDFRRIAVVMENFKTDEMLMEFCKNFPPPSIRSRAEEVYKKCISYKVKVTKKILKNLMWDPETPLIYYSKVQYCINEEVVQRFLDSYQSWVSETGPLWNDVYYARGDFFENKGYDRCDWKFYVKHADLLSNKADKIENLHTEVRTRLLAGRELVAKHDQVISSEYKDNSYGMSVYEREQELAQIDFEENLSDEEYCYVYTLEYPQDVFYVGIAANPQERLDQHVRGAFSNESHLFKSQFIRKYRNEIKLNIVYEGTRRECKEFEKAYIAEHEPLGNMTPGGEG